MHSNADTHSSSARPSRRGAAWLILFAALAAFGMYAWNHYLRPMRFEVEIDRPTLFTGAADTATIRAYGINRAGGRIPFSAPAIRAELLEGKGLGTLLPGDTDARFVSSGAGEGVVRLRIHAEGWPFPMLAEIRIVAPVALAPGGLPRHMSFHRSST